MRVTMDFSVAQGINKLLPKIYNSPIPTLSSNPATDYINPGINLKLYTEIVPITSKYSNTTKKAEDDLKVMEESSNLQTRDSEQSGTGVLNEKLIQHSFQHPRLIKTEVVTFGDKNVSLKRPTTSKSAEQPPSKTKKKSVSHRFQFF